jgi:hypothetical protein
LKIEDYTEIRALALIQDAINKLRLDLSGLIVLTESGSGYFSVTPVIAASANAARVYAWTRNSIYGIGRNNISETRKLLERRNLNGRVVFRLNERPQGDIENADIITNLGFVRPIDHSFISRTKPGTVVSTMCEKWEVRSNDIDIEACRKREVKVAGIWENHPRLRIFDSVGNLAVKLCLEAGFEIYQNKIAIWSNDDFGKVVKRTFEDFGADKVFLINRDLELSQIGEKSRMDFLFIADYTSPATIIGRGGVLDAAALSGYFGAIVHLCGKVDYEFAEKRGMAVYPKQSGYANRMTRTLAYLGPKPVIDLHTAGLKVGELLYKNKKSKLVQRIV